LYSIIKFCISFVFTVCSPLGILKKCIINKNVLLLLNKLIVPEFFEASKW